MWFALPQHSAASSALIANLADEGENFAANESAGITH
jgi:hypothetical protein